MYGKIDNGHFVQPPRILKGVELTFYDENGNPVTGFYDVGYDPNVEPEPDVVAYLLENGYLPVSETEKPEDGESYHYEPDYIEGDGEIVQSWERVDDPAPDPNPEISAERALGIILTGRDSYEAE